MTELEQLRLDKLSWTASDRYLFRQLSAAYAEIARLRTDLARVQVVCESLAARAAGQSDLLTAMAEKKEEN